MKHIMLRERTLAAIARIAGKATHAHVAALVLPLALLAGSASAANTTHTARLHRIAAQSAGTAETRGKVHASRVAHKTAESPSEKRRARRARAQRPSARTAETRVGRKNTRRRAHESEVVEAPVTRRRAARRETAATTRSEVPAQVEKKTLTVDDFVRAAGGSEQKSASTAPTAVPVNHAISEGVSHPDETERIEANEASHAAPHPSAPKVVQGFGGEVQVLPPTPAKISAREVPPSPSPAVLAAIADDQPTQHELTEEAIKPMAALLYTRSGKLIVPPALKGTREILVHQNQMANDEGLTRIQDDADLNRMREQHLLISFPDTAALDVNEELPLNRRYARPWTVKFAGDIARAYYAQFHEPLHLNSAVRTVDYQLRLQRVNGNAAAVEGETASPHLTGQAIDFGKRGMSVAQIAWMRSYLLPLMQSGKVDVEEEFQQACFHISVYGSYATHRRTSTELAQLHDQTGQ
jgi:hypothetical protein